MHQTFPTRVLNRSIPCVSIPTHLGHQHELQKENYQITYQISTRIYQLHLPFK